MATTNNPHHLLPESDINSLAAVNHGSNSAGILINKYTHFIVYASDIII